MSNQRAVIAHTEGCTEGQTHHPGQGKVKGSGWRKSPDDSAFPTSGTLLCNHHNPAGGLCRNKGHFFLSFSQPSFVGQSQMTPAQRHFLLILLIIDLALGGRQLAGMGVSIITDLMALGSQGTFSFVITPLLLAYAPICLQVAYHG